jgi:PKD repeat protein
LTVTDGANDTATASVVVVVWPALSATSSATPVTGTAPAAIDFRGSPVGGKAPYTYAWTLGDGGSSSLQNPSHTYAGPGTFTANLTVTDANGVSAVAAPLSVTVNPAPLVASAASARLLGDAPVVTTLSGSATGGVAPYTYAWDLGDGTSSTASQVGHTYSSAGTYTATLTVTDSHSVSSQATAHITVYPALGVSTSATPTVGSAPLQVGFSASASGGLSPYTFSWTYGDGATGAGASATHKYAAGNFHPTLTIHDAAGGSWTGPVATIQAAGHHAAAPPSAPAAPGGTSGPAPGQSPASVEPSTSPDSSPSAQPSPSSTAQPPPAGEPSGGSGSGSANNLGLLFAVLGSILTAGLGGSLFLGWRRLRSR